MNTDTNTPSKAPLKLVDALDLTTDKADYLKTAAACERLFPPSEGWTWLVRSDTRPGIYFANICKGSPRPDPRYPTYAGSPLKALQKAMQRALDSYRSGEVVCFDVELEN